MFPDGEDEIIALSLSVRKMTSLLPARRGSGTPPRYDRRSPKPLISLRSPFSARLALHRVLRKTHAEQKSLQKKLTISEKETLPLDLHLARNRILPNLVIFIKIDVFGGYDLFICNPDIVCEFAFFNQSKRFVSDLIFPESTC
jgi:hypothetical protein